MQNYIELLMLQPLFDEILCDTHMCQKSST